MLFYIVLIRLLANYITGTGAQLALHAEQLKDYNRDPEIRPGDRKLLYKPKKIKEEKPACKWRTHDAKLRATCPWTHRELEFNSDAWCPTPDLPAAAAALSAV